MLTHPDNGWVGTCLVVRIQPDLVTLFVFDQLVQLPGMMRADTLQACHLQYLDVRPGKCLAILVRQEEVAGSENMPA